MTTFFELISRSSRSVRSRAKPASATAHEPHTKIGDESPVSTIVTSIPTATMISAGT
jgi:hypothetical protein